VKTALLFVMAALYVGAGVNHFVHPAPYVKIMPPWIPQHQLLVYVSGVIEILLGLLLMPAYSRHWAAWGIILLLIAVFPANIQMLVNYRNEGNPALWIAILRLPIQALLIYWAYVYTSVKV
jgi:uncharacterized membrane protein